MGQAPSHPPVSDAIVPPQTRQRLSQSPYVNYFEVAAVQPSGPPRQAKPRSRPSTRSNSLSTSISSNKSETSSIRQRAMPSISEEEKVPALEWEEISGRRYVTQRSGQYFLLPCDDDESDRIVILVRSRQKRGWCNTNRMDSSISY